MSWEVWENWVSIFQAWKNHPLDGEEVMGSFSSSLIRCTCSKQLVWFISLSVLHTCTWRAALEVSRLSFTYLSVQTCSNYLSAYLWGVHSYCMGLQVCLSLGYIQLLPLGDTYVSACFGVYCDSYCLGEYPCACLWGVHSYCLGGDTCVLVLWGVQGQLLPWAIPVCLLSLVGQLLPRGIPVLIWGVQCDSWFLGEYLCACIWDVQWDSCCLGVHLCLCAWCLYTYVFICIIEWPPLLLLSERDMAEVIRA